MTRLLACVAVAVALALPTVARADLAEAVALYDAGRHDEAFDAFVALASEGDGQAMLYIARMYEAGEGIHQSRPTALTWYRRAAAHDIAAAYVRLGEMFEGGIGLPRNYVEAVRAFRAAADLGDTEAMVRLADLYAGGAGAMPDPSEAARLLKQAVDLGNGEAVAALEALVATGTVPSDVLEALGVPPPQPPSLPSIEELTASELGELPAEDEESPASSEDAPVATATSESETVAQLRSTMAAAFDRIEGADVTIDASEDVDGVVTVVLRGLSLVSPEGRWDIGDITSRFAPRGDGSFDATVQLPGDTGFYDVHGTKTGGVTLGHHEITGIYLPGLDLWTALHGDLRDLVVTSAPGASEPGGLAAAGITIEGTQEEVAEGKWSGPVEIVIEGLSLLDAAGEETGHVERIRLTGHQERVDMAFVRAFSAATGEAQQLFLAEPDRADPESATMLQELLLPVGTLARERAPLIGGMAFGLEIDGFVGRDETTGTPLSVDHVSLALSGEHLDRSTGDVMIAYEHSGLVVTVDGADQRYLPGDVVVRLALRDLPVEDAATMALEMMEGSLLDPGVSEDTMAMAAGFLALGLQQSMATAGSRLDIEEVSWRSPALTADMTGSLVASAESVQGAIGSVTLTVEGLDAAVAELSTQPDDPEAQEMAMPLAMLQAMGQRTEQEGVARHVYALELTPDGRMLLNGNDMGPMLDGMAVEEPTEEPVMP